MSRSTDTKLRSRLIRLASTMPKSPERSAVLGLVGTRTAAMTDATVRSFLAVLRSKLIQFDVKLMKTQPNIYRMGHYLKAFGKIESAVKRYQERDDIKAMVALKKAMAKAFIINPNGLADLPPVRNVFKQIDAWLEKEKLPSMTAR